jgi:hypothetical protein
MKSILLRIGGLITVIITVFVMVLTSDISPFKYSVYSIVESLVSGSEEIAEKVSYAIWEQRSLDAIILAILLFIGVYCCITILGNQLYLKDEMK